MTQDIINIVNKLGQQEGVQDGIQFLNIHGKATLMDLYPAEDDDDDSGISDVDYEMSNGESEDEQLEYDESIGDEVNLLNEDEAINGPEDNENGRNDHDHHNDNQSSNDEDVRIHLI